MFVQFLGESFTLAFLALLIPIILMETMLHYMENIAGRGIVVGMHDIISLALLILGITILIGIIAGLYPACLFARIPVVSALKGTYRTHAGKSFMRKLLISFQFTISLILIVGTIVIYHQMKFMKNAASTPLRPQ